MEKKSTALQPARARTGLRFVSFEDLFARMQETYDSVARRAFEIFEGRGRTPGQDLEDWLRAEFELLHPVHLEIADSNAALTVRAELPGFAAKDLEVSVEPRRLTITGKREAKDEGKSEKTFYTERRADRIFRVVDLPGDVDPDRTTANLKDGILELVMPKAAAPKKVHVEAKQG